MSLSQPVVRSSIVSQHLFVLVNTPDLETEGEVTLLRWVRPWNLELDIAHAFDQDLRNVTRSCLVDVIAYSADRIGLVEINDQPTRGNNHQGMATIVSHRVLSRTERCQHCYPEYLRRCQGMLSKDTVPVPRTFCNIQGVQL